MMQSTLDWYSGEIFEAKFILAFGVIVIFAGILFYLYGNTAAPRALLIPLLVIGILFAAIGGSMMYSNGKKVAEVKESAAQKKQEFIETEIKRVEDFQYLYPLSIAISSGCFLIAIGFLAFATNVHLRAIAIALIIFGSTFAVIDYFSKERADIYYKNLTLINKGER